MNDTEPNSAIAAIAKPLPSIDEANKPFWDGLKQSKLLLQTCKTCRTARFPVSKYCSFCLSDQSDWKECSCEGVVESFCIFHKAYWPGFASEIPYAVVQVRIDDGVRFFSNLVGTPVDQIEIGMRVKPLYSPLNLDITLLKFEKI